MNTVSLEYQFTKLGFQHWFHLLTKERDWTIITKGNDSTAEISKPVYVSKYLVKIKEGILNVTQCWWINRLHTHTHIYTLTWETAQACTFFYNTSIQLFFQTQTFSIHWYSEIFDYTWRSQILKPQKSEPKYDIPILITAEIWVWRHLRILRQGGVDVPASL